MSDSQITALALHYVGNQANDEPFVLSKKLFALDKDLNQLLTDWFLRAALKSEERYRFYDTLELRYNRVYSIVAGMFDNPGMFYDYSVDLATFLYENCSHPKIKGGDFYVVRFSGQSVGTEGCDAIGLFKIENKDTFLTVEPEADGFDISQMQGVSLKKMDKGCLVFNCQREDGFYVAAIDNTNRSEAAYWVDDFLHLERRQDAYFQTENAMTICHNYLSEQLPVDFEVNRADQVDMLNRSLDYFRKQPRFELDSFENQVIVQPEVIGKFDEYRRRFQDERQLSLEENFDVNPTAVRKQTRIFKSVIKLDRNFHIYIHGNRDLVEQGEDTHGKYYKLYYREES